jgi:hypothetical protein
MHMKKVAVVGSFLVIPGACCTYNDEDLAVLDKTLDGCEYHAVK